MTALNAPPDDLADRRAAARRVCAGPDRAPQDHRRPGRRDRAGLHRPGGGGQLPAGRRPGPGQDPADPLGGPGARSQVLADPVHARPDAVGRDRHRHRPGRSRRPGAGGWCSCRARSSPTSCSPTRSTGRRPRPSRRCWRRCRNTGSPCRDAPTRSTRRSSCSPPRTRSSSRAPIRCPRRSSTGSCSR